MTIWMAAGIFALGLGLFALAYRREQQDAQEEDAKQVEAQRRYLNEQAGRGNYD
jgi:preprotein translocase subunit SecG